MKKRIPSLSMAAALVAAVAPAAQAAVYSVGDLVLLAINSANPDSFRFTNLVQMDAGDVINFTDNGFTAGATGRTGEGFLTFTVPAGGYAPGNIFTWTNGMAITSTPWSSANPANFAFNGSGDQLYIFTGSTANWASQSGISLIFGVNYGTALSSTSAAANTVQPTALASSGFLNLGSSTYANTYFANGSTSQTSISLSATKAQILGTITDNTKWFGASATAATFPSYSISPIPEPSAFAAFAGLAALGLGISRRRRRG